ncbi:MAG: hypothetical protein HZA34_02195 [Candidatus Pacebacteria bacterium]|nr:hypothetical protein [Candidatus Paceibacterota bacterium]
MSNEKDPVREAAIQALTSRGITPEEMSSDQYEAAVKKQMEAISITSTAVRLLAGATN